MIGTQTQTDNCSLFGLDGCERWVHNNVQKNRAVHMICIFPLLPYSLPVSWYLMAPDTLAVLLAFDDWWSPPHPIQEVDIPDPREICRRHPPFFFFQSALMYVSQSVQGSRGDEYFFTFMFPFWFGPSNDTGLRRTTYDVIREVSRSRWKRGEGGKGPFFAMAAVPTDQMGYFF